ncbi:MAG: dihydroxyacetone kinase phosphoryl donor subunit DhaM [Alphaproteobacteria bacterium]|nr:dihydroxyacetone kinase phosphoryl donor subunit DhaM [Alphaproteobacteria bacterium]
MNATVGIVIVSHSADVARGAADMVRGMVGDEVPLGHAGGNPAGGLGTDVGAIREAIEGVWSEAGVAILVDLGAAEMNTEMAIELLPDRQRRAVRICNAPVVEGAVVAATEASGGGSLDEVCMTAESALL